MHWRRRWRQKRSRADWTNYSTRTADTSSTCPSNIVRALLIKSGRWLSSAGSMIRNFCATLKLTKRSSTASAAFHTAMRCWDAPRHLRRQRSCNTQAARSKALPPGDAEAMSRPTIRPAAPADIAAITAIYRPAVLHGTASFELTSPDEREMLSRFTAMTAGGFPYLAAEMDGTVVGYAYANAYRTRPAYRYSVEDSVYVAPRAQRTGVGRLLLDTLIETCTE